ncbi:tyrosine-type recombinase/integrase [Fischerella thermalis]|uniref:tyrosine-type recombinase/integrase n=1 Tax=Fischerella thermalis TaxID=372787 RepID=UPI0019F2BCDD|nr:tyrosine-type recombinase/integrase [Fischerella thermalis]MBF1990838.1 tyrosine-type recombinase/integrase [Fischerella thermalis M58_A2018_009]MBF2061268.1 tyrosine-type recombinase/integrase [Fischerella thermalis M66_A2018_004]
MALSLVNVSNYRQALATLSPSQAEAKLIALWLDGKAESSVQAYQRYTKRFFIFLGKPLKQVTYEDLVEYATQFQGQALSTRRMYLAAAKSLISFAHKIGYLPFNVGMALKLSEMPDAINERYLDEADIKLLVRMAQKKLEEAKTAKRQYTARRNLLIIKVLYQAGLRANELCQLTWADLTPRGDSGQVYVRQAKGSKNRTVLIKSKLWAELMEFKGKALATDAVFQSQKGGHLDRQNLHPMIKEIAEAAGLSDKVSAHWLRHAHGSHAIERGTNPILVKETLGHANLATTDRYLKARPSDSSALKLMDV